MFVVEEDCVRSKMTVVGAEQIKALLSRPGELQC